jgi:hypothetical protein
MTAATFLVLGRVTTGLCANWIGAFWPVVQTPPEAQPRELTKW